MLIRSCCRSSLNLTEKCLLGSPCAANYLSSSSMLASNFYAPGCLGSLKTDRSYNQVPVRGMRLWATSSSFPVRRKYSSSKNPNYFSQAANFISAPGSTPTRKEFSERRIIGYTMEQMFDVVADVEKYQEFLPWCQSSVIKSRRKGHVTADLTVGMSPVVESYTSSVTLTRPHLIKAESTQGRLFNQLITLWKFSPGLKGKPQSCIVEFYVSFEFRSSITSQVATVFFNELVRAMAGAFYHEAKKRYGSESVPSRKVKIIPEGSDKHS